MLLENKFYASLFSKKHRLEEAGNEVNETTVQNGKSFNFCAGSSGSTGKAAPVSAALYGRNFYVFT